MKNPFFPTMPFVYLLAVWFVVAGQSTVMAEMDAAGSVDQARAPRIFPDYNGIFIPPNMAPLNFKVEEPGNRYRVELRSTRGDPVTITSRNTSIQIPADAWHALLRANTGEPLVYDISVQTSAGSWTHFERITNY